MVGGRGRGRRRRGGRGEPEAPERGGWLQLMALPGAGVGDIGMVGEAAAKNTVPDTRPV
eukprot:SAG31_NODE_1785_length_7278_cov_4.205321_3_plen_59_part_00